MKPKRRDNKLPKKVKGENNVVFDALSFLDMSDNWEILNISELYGYNDDDLPDSAYPIRYRDIAKAQKMMLDYNKSQSHIKTISSTPFVGATKTIV